MCRVLTNKLRRNVSKLMTIAIACTCMAFYVIMTKNSTFGRKIIIASIGIETFADKQAVYDHSKYSLSVRTSSSHTERTTSVSSSMNIQSEETKTTFAPSTIPTTTPKNVFKIGHVNVHLWYQMCMLSLDYIRQQPLFPLWPSVRGTPQMPNELELITSESWSLQRVMGLLYPTVSGKYRFKIFTESLAEFWLSTSESPEKAVMIARHNKNVFFGVKFTDGRMISESQFVHLNQGQSYYFEMLHGVTNNVLKQAKVRVQWMLPGTDIFAGIPKTALSTVIEVDNHVDNNTRKFLLSSSSVLLRNTTAKKARQYEWENRNFSAPFQPFLSITRDSLNTIEFVDRWKIMSAFNECDYMPSYVIKKKYKLYEGIRHTHFTDVFPTDETSKKYWRGGHSWLDVVGNTVIKESVVIDIVDMFMAYLNRHIPGAYTLANVISVERNVDAKRGSRFLLDLFLLDTKTKRLQRLSEYIFQSKNNPGKLCKPKNLTWSSKVQINAIITTKSQGPWVIHYIKNMADIVHATKDDNVHFIVVDYGNNGVDVAEEFRRNNISKFTILKKKGKFHKTLAINDAAESIKDNNSIVFLTDLHLNAPHNLFENVRKHTIKGIMSYTPVLFRLSLCSRPESEPIPIATGYWEAAGYGIFSTFKSDWDSFGGVNAKKFKHKWGGEDWEMVDRVLAKGIEIERIKLPQFFHFYHDRSNMWDKA